MKISNFEKYIVENQISDEILIKFLENINETLEYDFTSSRKLTDEEIDYEYFDNFIIEFIESSVVEQENTEEECECHAHHKGHLHTHDNKNETKEERFNDSMKQVHIMAMYLLRDGINYVDLVQEGLVGLVKANNLYSKNLDFKKNKLYFVAKEMIEYIKKQSIERKLAFKQYIQAEKEKEVKLKLSPKVRLKERNETIKKAEIEKKEEHKKEIERLEELTKGLFEYFNLKYRLSVREIEVLFLYFGLDGNGKKNFSDIEKAMGIPLDMVDKILKESIFKLSVGNEKVEI